MLYLVLFSTLAVGFYAATTVSIQIARNERGLEQAQAAADGGMQFIRYQLGQILIDPTIPQSGLLDAVAVQLGLQMNGTANMNGHMVQNTGGTIYIPAQNGWISLDPSTGSQFRIIITQSGTSLVINATGSGSSITLKKAIQLQYQPAERAGALFDYGIASKSPISMNGNVRVQGASNPAMGSVLVATASGSGLTLSGSPAISGDYSYVNPSLTNSFGGGTIAGYAPGSPNFSQHVHAGVAMPLFPWIDTSVYAQYATNPYVPGSTTLANVTLPPGTYSFGNVTIQGVLYVQSPCNLTINGQSKVQGVIVTDNNSTLGTLSTNVINFAGKLQATGIDTLPTTFPAAERALTGAFVIAPYYTLNMSGNFGSIDGSILASQISMSGNAAGTIQGSLINLADTSMSFAGNGSVTIAGTGTSNVPAGVSFGHKYTPLPGTYLEVAPK